MPTPTITRPANRVDVVGASASTTAPKTMPVTNRTRRRPNRSDQTAGEGRAERRAHEGDAGDHALHGRGQVELRPDEQERSRDHARVVAEQQPPEGGDDDQQAKTDLTFPLSVDCRRQL